MTPPLTDNSRGRVRGVSAVRGALWALGIGASAGAALFAPDAARMVFDAKSDVSVAEVSSSQATRTSPVTRTSPATRTSRTSLASSASSSRSLDSPLLPTLSRITLSGRVHLPRDVIEEAIGARIGDSFGSFSAEGVRFRVESLEEVLSAEAYKRLPGRLHVIVVERVPFAIHQLDGRHRVIDREGRVLSRYSASSWSDLPLAVGQGAASEFSSLINAVETWDELRSRMESATRIGDRRWDLHLRDGLTAMLPERGLVEAISRLRDLHERTRALDRRIERIDMRLSDRIVFLGASL